MHKQSESRQQVREWLDKLEVADGIRYRNLTIFPLVWTGEIASEDALGDPTWPGNGGRRYTLLAEAVEAQEAQVEEVSAGGQVPFLGVKNTGGKPILIPEGEILVGAKQNRVVNLTVLVAAKTTFKLPVSCVEQGRWSYRSRDFRPAAFAHPRLRDLKVRSAQQSRNSMGLAMADQGAVWDEVHHHLGDMAIASETSDFVESFAAAEDRLETYREKIELPSTACGFIAARGGEVVGLDLFDTPETMHKLWRRMSDAYFLEATRIQGKEVAVPRKAAQNFLSQVIEHLEEAGQQPPLGVEFEIADERLSGSALFFEGAVCHLSAFGPTAAV